MKFIAILFSLLVFVGCQNNKTKSVQENKAYPFFVGTYTDGESQGIYKYLLEDNGTLKQIGLAAITDNPSFLSISADKRFLVAVNENKQEGNKGSVASFLISEDTLAFISKSPSGGDHPCFVSVNEAGYVLSANYTGGNVGLLKMDNDGELSEVLDVQQHIGSGITDRQKSPHAHSSWFEPGNNGIISVDLGTNELWFSQLDTIQNKLLPSNPQKISMAPGAGPRHLTFHPNGKWVYVVNELDCTVTLLLKTDKGTYQPGASISTLPTDIVESYSCADIHVSLDGKFVYASNRGHNSIAILGVNPNDGTLNLLGNEPTHGNSPRNFSLSPDNCYLLVANQLTNNIVSFKRDQSTGLLKYVNEIEAPTPVCILFQ